MRWGKPSMFFEAYFGIRTQSMLHINPYDVIGVGPSEGIERPHGGGGAELGHARGEDRKHRLWRTASIRAGRFGTSTSMSNMLAMAVVS